MFTPAIIHAAYINGPIVTVRRAVIKGKPWTEYSVRVIRIDGDTLTYTTDGMWSSTITRNKFADWS